MIFRVVHSTFQVNISSCLVHVKKNSDYILMALNCILMSLKHIWKQTRFSGTYQEADHEHGPGSSKALLPFPSTPWKHKDNSLFVLYAATTPITQNYFIINTTISYKLLRVIKKSFEIF